MPSPAQADDLETRFAQSLPDKLIDPHMQQRLALLVKHMNGLGRLDQSTKEVFVDETAFRSMLGDFSDILPAGFADVYIARMKALPDNRLVDGKSLNSLPWGAIAGYVPILKNYPQTPPMTAQIKNAATTEELQQILHQLAPNLKDSLYDPTTFKQRYQQLMSNVAALASPVAGASVGASPTIGTDAGAATGVGVEANADIQPADLTSIWNCFVSHWGFWGTVLAIAALIAIGIAIGIVGVYTVVLAAIVAGVLSGYLIAALVGLGGDAVVLLDCILPDWVQAMTTTTITGIENRSPDTVALLDIANLSAPGSGTAIAPGTTFIMNINVPWATSAADFPQSHLELQIGGQTRFWLWQAIWTDGDQSNYVRFSQDGAWHDPGTPVFGVPAVTGPRTLVVQEDGCFQLVSYPDTLIAAVQQVAAGLTIGTRCTPSDFNPPPPPASVPKLSAVAFSMAGIPSDAFKQGVPDARFLYRDSGKRYEFSIDNGYVVHARGPDGNDIPLTSAVSYAAKRVGEWTQQGQITLPPIDLIAANGGRVFAKAQGQDAFYFMTMDQMFIGADDQGREFVIPSSYFKLDPEFNQPGAQLADLLAPFRGCFADHPAAARFPFFRWLLAQNLNFADMMMVSMQPQVWHLLDTRPPRGIVNMQAVLDAFAVQVLAQVQSILAPLQIVAPWLPILTQLNAVLATSQAQLQQEQANLALPNPTKVAPPSWVPTYNCVAYCESATGAQSVLTAVRYVKVLDIGVGHVHWHEQYESITGGELQPMRSGPYFPSLSSDVNFAYGYRFLNGPVNDGDGYVDGTCNFYALVQLKGDAKNIPEVGVLDGYALLYMDEQSFFSGRWHVVHPDDYSNTQGLTLPYSPPWQPQTYWCPFRAGMIGSKSRMAVSRQVLIVNGWIPGVGTEPNKAVLYSINFSYSTMDRTWRWRSLPVTDNYFDNDTDAGLEAIPPTGGDCVYPQTVRLREDMTIHIKGRRQWGANPPAVGRWYQRYLPATNELVPSAPALMPNTMPAPGYTHVWKFLPEAVFQAADQFSHFGVYDIVDSRTQYYSVVPATATDAATLVSAGPGPWVDVAGKLYVRAWKFWWAAPLRPPDCCGPDAAGTADSLLHYEGRPERLPSLFNSNTLLRIEQRSGQWVALHWDKRDDDIMPFDGLPMQVVLQNGPAQATVTLQANTWVEEPPVVSLATFVWSPAPDTPVTLVLTNLPFPPIWRVRMAALDASRPGGMVWLLDVEMEGTFTPQPGNINEYTWTPTPAQAADIQRYCSSKAVAEQYGTSIWCEDIVGHVSVPEDIQWPVDNTPPTLTLPSTITTDATSPQGVVVNYTVTATDPDNTADQITITCTPASGSMFPIGTTIVQCTALDPTGNAATGSFQIIVKGASGQISDLIALVNSFNLSPKGSQTSFDSQLQTVQADLAANNTAQACSDLTSFINHVNAQSGKQLTTTQANELLTAARQIQVVLAC